MRNRSAVLWGALLPLFGATSALALPAYPGAEGFGANSTGGRGGDVYHVTTLVDDPTHEIRGSLFFGLYSKNVPGSGTTAGTGRTIVFDVGGTINLGATKLDLKDIKNVTVAGQTAPSPVTIIGNTVQITSGSGKETGNIIFQHVGVRKGLANSGDALSVLGAGNTHDILVDHVSGSWSEDEVISVAGPSNHAQNVTVEYSTMSEALTSGHQYGALIRMNTSASVSYNHNLFSNNVSRNPRPGTYVGTQLDFEFQNNVIYNWSDRAGYTGGASETDTENVNMNYVGNYVIAGPSTVGGPTTAGGTPVIGAKRNTAFTKDASGDPLNLKVYQSGNKIDWSSGATRDGQDIGWGAFANWNGSTSSAFPAGDQVARFGYPVASPDSADDAYGKMISTVGAMPWARGTTDQRLISEVLNYGGVAGQTAPNTAEWNALVAGASQANWTVRAANYDQEDNGNYTPTSWEGTQTNPQAKPKGDGMPTAWENLRGYNPLVSDNNVVESDGYTRLEHYLQYLTLQANWNSTGADGNWSDHLNWRGARPEGRDSTANFTTGNNAPRTVNVDMPVSVGQMSFGSNFSYTLDGANAVNFDVFSGSATIDVTAGSHAIWAPVTLADNTIVTAATNSGLTMTNLQPSTVTLTKAGAGGLAVNNVRAQVLNVTGGSVVVLANSGTSGISRVNTLSISAGAALDLNDNDLVVNGGNFSAIQGLVLTGYRGGPDSTATGIVSTTSQTVHGGTTILAVFDNSLAGFSDYPFGSGQTISANAIVGKYTYIGDTNYDGQVTPQDYTATDSNLGTSAPVGISWFYGDTNFDGNIDATDYAGIDGALGLGTGNPLAMHAMADFDELSRVVPEVGSLIGLMGAAGVLMGMRGRRLR
jgi:hypothetical protein